MPSITIWNRLEPRSRSQDMKAGLEARVHDPLWLLARQWQIGEFAGRDAGSPVTVNVQATAAALDRYASGDEAGRAYDNRLPLETLVEREAVRPARAADDLRQAAEAGLHFFRLLDAAGLLSRLGSAYLAQYPLAAPPAGLDSDARRFAAIVSGRVIDGIQLHADLSQAASNLPPLPALAGTDRDAVLPVAQAWLTWYGSLFSEPEGADAWSPDRMEYRFAVGAAGGSGAFTAKEYDGGAIDWHTFDRSSAPLAGGSAQRVTTQRSVVASPVTFRGMPARRFWELEDASVDIGALTAGAEDLGRLLLREFALIYGNDWFQIPLAVPVGSEVSIDSLTVADTFGLTAVIPHYADADGAAGRWRMFSLSTGTGDQDAASARLLVVVSSAVGTLESAAIEDVLLLRDELADMAWGVERSAVGPSGRPVDRALVWKANAPPVQPPAADAPPRYRLGSSVPDYWIPFLPVAVGSGPLRMRRGRLPTAASGPLGRLLGYPGLTIFLEELPREGVRLERRYRYARGLDGSPCVWVGRRRSTGRGEGRSGLRFDSLE
jgi:hypothetical protein